MAYNLNISFVVDPKVYPSWYSFMYDKFLPFVEEESLFDRVQFSRVLSEGVQSYYTFSLLTHFETLDGYRKFKGDIMSEYIEFADPMFGTKVTHFMTLMKEIKESSK